ncbi:hypothetical protein GXW78_06545 [Roseomonas terrae]|uniref:VCBS repeat-containing protein n=1 Tax=Neoroseomonas terrae TaxID=424799 RepID=A0ABS5EE74_9PROT|nr:hypothetical protein [Neoroseomonas terrae]MBR0649313.1 hypothetical protein [Neoroseomonas terrae]
MRRALLTLLLTFAIPAEAARTTLRANRPGATPLELRATSNDEYWVIDVLEGGVSSQRIEVQSDLPNTLPRLIDTNGDGAADLWVPVIGGNANTAWDIWLMEPGGARFRRAGEVSGVGFSRAGGRLVSLGRNGCCAVSYTFHDFTPEGRLREAFAVERQIDDLGRGTCEPSEIAITAPADAVTSLCRLRPGQLPGTVFRLP